MQNGKDWPSMECAIAAYLPAGGAGGRRTLLLEQLQRYAAEVVQEARRLAPPAVYEMDCTQALSWLTRPVFICGHHRSGTTLLQHLLDSHPQLLVLPSEGTYFTSFSYAARTHTAATDVDRFVRDWIARLVDPNHEPHYKLGRSSAADCPALRFAQRLIAWHIALARARPDLRQYSLLLALVASFRDVVAPGVQPLRWIEKTPRNERFLKRLERFPEARFIQLVRDPAATLASIMQLERGSKTDLVRAARHARRIAQSMRLATKLARRYRGRFLITRYEDLTAHPESTMERVRNFLGIVPAASLLTPTELGIPVRRNSSFPTRNSGAGTIELPHSNAALTPLLENIVGAYSGTAARALSYHVTTPNLSTRLALRLRELAAMARRRHS